MYKSFKKFLASCKHYVKRCKERFLTFSFKEELRAGQNIQELLAQSTCRHVLSNACKQVARELFCDTREDREPTVYDILIAAKKEQRKAQAKENNDDAFVLVLLNGLAIYMVVVSTIFGLTTGKERMMAHWLSGVVSGAAYYMIGLIFKKAIKT